MLKALEPKKEPDSVLEFLGERRIEYSVVEQPSRLYPKPDLQRLRREEAKYHLFISLERSGVYFISVDMISLEFEGSKLIMRSCRKILTGP